MTSSSDFPTMHQLTPLYVNGALSAQERRRFEEELWRNRALRREVAEFAEIEAAYRAVERHSFPDLGAALDTVMTRTSAHEAPETVSHPLAQRLRAMLAAPRLAWVVCSVQLAIIGVLLAYGPMTRDATELQSLSESTDTQTARRFNVVFSDDASQAEIRALLQELHARISDGPTAVGLVTLEIRDEQVDTQTLIGRLRASKLVRFAEAAY